MPGRGIGVRRGSDLETAQIEQDRHLLVDLFTDRADIVDQFRAIVRRAMGRVDAHHVGPCDDQVAQAVSSRHSGSEGCNDLYMSVTCQSVALASRNHAKSPVKRHRIARSGRALATLQASTF